MSGGGPCFPRVQEWTGLEGKGTSPGKKEFSSTHQILYYICLLSGLGGTSHAKSLRSREIVWDTSGSHTTQSADKTCRGFSLSARSSRTNLRFHIISAVT